MIQMKFASLLVWIASVLSPKSSAQYYLSKFLGAIESYLHPANSGKWIGSISEVVVQLPKYLFDRLVYERYKPHPWKRAVPGTSFLFHSMRQTFPFECSSLRLINIFSLKISCKNHCNLESKGKGGKEST